MRGSRGAARRWSPRSLAAVAFRAGWGAWSGQSGMLHLRSPAPLCLTVLRSGRMGGWVVVEFDEGTEGFADVVDFESAGSVVEGGGAGPEQRPAAAAAGVPACAEQDD